MINFDLSRRAARVAQELVKNGFSLQEKLALSRAVNKANSFDDLPEKYKTAILIAEKRLDDLARTQ